MTMPEAVIFDIETGPLPDKELEFFYDEPTFDEFAANCDQRWKPETVREKYEKSLTTGWAKFKDRAALDAVTVHVVAIGVLSVYGGGDRTLAIIDCDEVDGAGESGPCETEGLDEFWAVVKQCLAGRVPMIGFNIHSFDLPFLVRRSWIVGSDIPLGVRVGRYWNELFIDLMAAWSFGAREYIGLDTVAKAFGFPGKIEDINGVKVSGADFHKLWQSDRPVAEEYLRRDLELPLRIARRLEVI